MKALIKNGNIEVVENEEISFVLHLKSIHSKAGGPDVDAVVESCMERIVACVNDFEPIPTKTIQSGFVQKTMHALSKAGKVITATQAAIKDLNDHTKKAQTTSP